MGANSSTAQSQSTQLKTVNNKIITLKKNLALKKNQQGELEHELKSIDQRIAAITPQLQALNKKIAEKQTALSASRKQLASLKKEYAKQKDALGKQLRASYQLGQYEYTHLLLNQQDPATVLRLMAYYNYINKARAETLIKVQETEKKIRDEQHVMTTQVKQLSHLSKAAETKKIQLQLDREKQQKIMTQLGRDIKNQSSQLKAYEADQKFLEALVKRLDHISRSSTVKKTPPEVEVNTPSESSAPMVYKIQTGSFSKEAHHLIWPTHGKLLNRATVPMMRHQPGIMILAPEGQSVISVFPGKVVFSGALKGFGLLMIIDHGQGFMTLYAHNQALYRKRGDHVNAGDLIAYVGHTGILPQSGLYFEVRHFGRPLNPLQWLSPMGKT